MNAAYSKDQRMMWPGFLFLGSTTCLASVFIVTQNKENLLTLSSIWEITYKALTLLSIKAATSVSRESAGHNPLSQYFSEQSQKLQMK